jgi:flagellar motor switch protein FliN/FliY
MEVTIEIGRTRLPVGELLRLQPGQVLALDREVGSPLDMFINGTLLARGEIVIVDDQFGFRVTSVVVPE